MSWPCGSGSLPTQDHKLADGDAIVQKNPSNFTGRQNATACCNVESCVDTCGRLGEYFTKQPDSSWSATEACKNDCPVDGQSGSGRSGTVCKNMVADLMPQVVEYNQDGQPIDLFGNHNAYC